MFSVKTLQENSCCAHLHGVVQLHPHAWEASVYLTQKWLYQGPHAEPQTAIHTTRPSCVTNLRSQSRQLGALNLSDLTDLQGTRSLNNSSTLLAVCQVGEAGVSRVFEQSCRWAAAGSLRRPKRGSLTYSRIWAFCRRQRLIKGTKVLFSGWEGGHNKKRSCHFDKLINSLTWVYLIKAVILNATRRLFRLFYLLVHYFKS